LEYEDDIHRVGPMHHWMPGHILFAGLVLLSEPRVGLLDPSQKLLSVRLWIELQNAHKKAARRWFALDAAIRAFHGRGVINRYSGPCPQGCAIELSRRMLNIRTGSRNDRRFSVSIFDGGDRLFAVEAEAKGIETQAKDPRAALKRLPARFRRGGHWPSDHHHIVACRGVHDLSRRRLELRAPHALHTQAQLNGKVSGREIQHLHIGMGTDRIDLLKRFASLDNRNQRDPRRYSTLCIYPDPKRYSSLRAPKGICGGGL
jgi:hypothetical protein